MEDVGDQSTKSERGRGGELEGRERPAELEANVGEVRGRSRGEEGGEKKRVTTTTGRREGEKGR